MKAMPNSIWQLWEKNIKNKYLINIVEPIIEGVKAKITVDAIGDVADALKGLFAKK